MVDTILDGMQVASVTSDAFRQSAALNHHHVAVVLSRKSGKVLASGVNLALPAGSVHAERSALHQLHTRIANRVICRRELGRGLRLLSLRVSSTGKLRLAKPCAECERAIRSCPYGVRCVAWSDNDGNLVELRL